MKKKKPTKLTSEELLKRVRSAVESGDYLDTRHATDRKNERGISRLEIEYVLKNGWHEKKKDKFEEGYDSWKYAMRGKTIDKKDLRIIIAFQNKMLIITAMEVGK